ncbi:MAG: hypothetical protein ACLRUN_12140 [Christensenellales bacterium]
MRCKITPPKMFQKDTNRNNDTSKKRLWQVFLTIIGQKANSTQKAGAQCAPLRVQRCNARLFFRNVVGARIARPLSEFMQNLGFAHLPFLTKRRRGA